MSITSDIGFFSIIPEWLLDATIPAAEEGEPPTLVSANSIRLFAVLHRYADKESGEAFPSRKTLAERMGVSVDTVDRAARELVAVGALTISHRRTERGDSDSNNYHLSFVQPGGRTDAETGMGTDAATGRRVHAALTKASRNESHSELKPPSSPSAQKGDSPLKAPRKRELTATALAELAKEFPAYDVEAAAVDYLNYGPNKLHNDKVMGLRNMLKDARRNHLFLRNRAASSGWQSPPPRPMVPIGKTPVLDWSNPDLEEKP